MKKPNRQEPVYKVKSSFSNINNSSMISIIWEIEKKNINTTFYVTDLSLLYAAVPPFFLALQLKLHEPESKIENEFSRIRATWILLWT